MQHNAADDLHTVMPHTQHAPRRLAAGGKRLGQQIVKRFAVLVACLELIRFGAQLGVGQFFVLLLERVDLVGDGVDFL